MVMEQTDSQKITPANNAAKTGASHTSTSSSSSPSFDPHSLGREFVRQYYTVLNKGPQILHSNLRLNALRDHVHCLELDDPEKLDEKFYGEDSSFIHGSLNKPGDNSVDTVYGDEEIDKRIGSLKFKDCHAKIRQVDSLETLDKGVVVQVSGELSNNGQPMRRFFQTFVLAPRSPTNYYVRNDIFRYQDEPASDEDDHGDCVERHVVNEVAEKIIQPEIPPPQTVSVPPPQPSPETFPTLQSSASKDATNTGLPNGHADDSSPLIPTESVESEWERNQADTENKTNESIASVPTPQPSGPISWAAIMKKQDPDTTGSSFISSNCSTLKPIPSSSDSVLHVPSIASPISPSSSITVPQSTSGKSPKGNDSRSNRRPRKQENRDSVSGTTENQTGVDLGDSPPMANSKKSVSAGFTNSSGVYADDQQVFVGNLPQDITEDTLRQFFSKYGSILDVRINRTNQQKNSNTRTPNYGFVTFDKVEIVQSILKQKHRFNVEEKRSQGRASGKGGQDGNPGRRGERNSDGPRTPSGSAGNRNEQPTGQRRDRWNRDKPSFSERKDEQQRKGNNSNPGNGNANSSGRGGGVGGQRR